MSAAAALAVSLGAYLATGRLLGLYRFDSWPGRWQRTLRLQRSTVGRVPLAAVLGTAGLGVGGWTAAAAVTGSPWIGLPAGVLVALVPLRRRARRRARRLEELQEAWPDGLRQLVATVRSGATVEAAVAEMARTGPEPLREAFARFATLAAAMGVVAALQTVRAAVGDATTDRVVEVLIVAHESGGPVVPDVLDDLASAVTEDLRTVEEVRTAGLEQRLNARIVFAVPWGLLVLLTSRQGMYRDFYASPPGTAIILGAAALSGLALIVVGRLGREPLEQRVLVDPEQEGGR